MVDPSKQAAGVCAGLILIITACLYQGAQSASSQVGDSRMALMNPTHRLWREQSPDVCKVRVETSKGDFVVEVHRNWAPLGADRFYNLARAGFFDNSRFFRVRAGFIAQFGIPGNPTIAAV